MEYKCRTYCSSRLEKLFKSNIYCFQPKTEVLTRTDVHAAMIVCQLQHSNLLFSKSWDDYHMNGINIIQNQRKKLDIADK